MQATAASTQATPRQLAGQLHELWMHLLRGGSQLYALIEELGLSLTHMKVLQVLQAAEEELSIKDLAELLGMSLPGTSRTVDALLRRDYVERREDDRDRRMKRVRIAPAGVDVVQRLEAARLENLERFVGDLSPEERGALSAALQPVLARHCTRKEPPR